MPTATKTRKELRASDLEHIEKALGSVMNAVDELTLAVDAKRSTDGTLYTPAEPPLVDGALAMRLVVFAEGLRTDAGQLRDWAKQIEEAAVQRHRTFLEYGADYGQ